MVLTQLQVQSIFPPTTEVGVKGANYEPNRNYILDLYLTPRLGFPLEDNNARAASCEVWRRVATRRRGSDSRARCGCGKAYQDAGRQCRSRIRQHVLLLHHPTYAPRRA